MLFHFEAVKERKTVQKKPGRRGEWKEVSLISDRPEHVRYLMYLDLACGGSQATSHQAMDIWGGAESFGPKSAVVEILCST